MPGLNFQFDEHYRPPNPNEQIILDRYKISHQLFQEWQMFTDRNIGDATLRFQFEHLDKCDTPLKNDEFFNNLERADQLMVHVILTKDCTCVAENRVPGLRNLKFYD